MNGWDCDLATYHRWGSRQMPLVLKEQIRTASATCQPVLVTKLEDLLSQTRSWNKVKALAEPVTEAAHVWSGSRKKRNLNGAFPRLAFTRHSRLHKNAATVRLLYSLHAFGNTELLDAQLHNLVL